jgi:hypothetical protein
MRPPALKFELTRSGASAAARPSESAQLNTASAQEDHRSKADERSNEEGRNNGSHRSTSLFSGSRR